MSSAMKPAILGGTPVRSNPFTPRTTMGPDEQAAAHQVLESNVLSAFIGSSGKYFNGGVRVQEFEKAWCDTYRFKHGISVNSWTAGLVTAIGACGIEPGDEVICPPYTMSASATCALFYGGIPVFADIDAETCCIDATSIERCITPRTKAIVVVHLFGHPADMDSIMSLARRHRLRVIEDAAQAPGVFYNGHAVGSIGDIGGFSLNFHKHIHTGEGGMIVTSDDRLAQRCRLIRNHGENALEGMAPEDMANCFGNNYRLTEIQAAIGTAQLAKLQGHLLWREKLASHLRIRLAGIQGLRLQAVPTKGSTHAYYVLPMFFDAAAAGLSRSQFVRAVLAELPFSGGVESVALTEGYVKPLYLTPMYQNRIAMGTRGFPFNLAPPGWPIYEKGLCPVTERLYEKELLLSTIVREPLTTTDMDDFANAILKVLENASSIAGSIPLEAKLFTPVDAAMRTNDR
jgi:perosamine synthetase